VPAARSEGRPLHHRSPEGVRISLRPGAVNAEKLQQQFACHKSLAAAKPQAPTACAFFDARTEAEVKSAALRSFRMFAFERSSSSILYSISLFHLFSTSYIIFFFIPYFSA
jgi:hypothetical protein